MIDLNNVPTSQLLSVLGKRRRAKQAVLPRQPVLRPCLYCGVEYGARKLRKHLPGCRKTHRAADAPIIKPEPTLQPGPAVSAHIAGIHRFRGPAWVKPR